MSTEPTRNKILLDSVMTKTGHMLIQGRESIWVLTGCCQAQVETRDDGDFICSSCEEDIVPGNGYSTKVTFEDIQHYGWKSGWKGWLNHWFGLEDGEITFEGIDFEDPDE